MEKALDPSPLEPAYINTFKKDLWEDLTIRFEKNLNRGVLAKASFLDKRFSKLKFLGQEEKETVLSELLAELKVMEAENVLDKEGNLEPPAKKSRFLGSGFCSSDEEEEGGEKKLKCQFIGKKWEDFFALYAKRHIICAYMRI